LLCRGGRADSAWVIDEIAANGETTAFFFYFLWAIVYTDAAISDIFTTVIWNFVMTYEKDGVGAGDSIANSLG
jgi:hypothetical protein